MFVGAPIGIVNGTEFEDFGGFGEFGPDFPSVHGASGGADRGLVIRMPVPVGEGGRMGLPWAILAIVVLALWWAARRV